MKLCNNFACTFQLDLQVSLERGRFSQFYADMLTMDSQSLNVVALALSILLQKSLFLFFYQGFTLT